MCDQRLDLLRVGADIINVVVERFGGIAEVDHDSVLLAGVLRFDIERKAPLVVQRAAIVALARGGFDLDILHLAGTQKQVVGAVDEDAHRKLVDDRRNDRRCARDLDTAEAASRRSRCHRCRSFQVLGWTDGRNVRIDYRWGAGDASRIRA
jgi:hypothetical protein